MILYVVRYHPALSETFVREELRALHAAGVQVALAAFDRRDDVDAPLPVPVHAQPHRWGWLRALPGLIVEWLRRPAWVSPRVLWLARLARTARRLHVHFAGEAADWARVACARAGVPYSVTVHAADLFKPHAQLDVVLGSAVSVATISEFNRKQIAQRHGVATLLVRMTVDVPPPGTPSSPPVVLTAGRAVPKKGLHLVAAVASRLDRPARVVAYANLPPSPGLEVCGLRPHAEVLAAMATATVFVLPCRVAPDGDMDGIPVVLLEALAHGVPVVTTPVSGIPELVDEQVGWLVPPDDEEALLGAVRAALDDPAEARRRGLAGQRRVVERGFARDPEVRALRGFLGA